MFLFFLFLLLLQITVQTLSLVSPLLPSLCLRVKLFLLAVGFEVHSEIIELLCPCEILRFFLFLFKKFVGPVVSTEEILFFLIFRFLMFDSAAEMLLLFLMNPNVSILKIDQGSFLIGGKKMIFPIIINPLERLN